MRTPVTAAVLACFVALCGTGCGGRNAVSCWTHGGLNVVGSPGDDEVSSADNQVEVRTGMSEKLARWVARLDRARHFAVVDQVGGSVLAWERKPTEALRRRVQSCLR
jgi:hypothetical protein